MKTKANLRVLAIMIMVGFTLSSVAAQNKNRDRRNDNRQNKAEQKHNRSEKKYNSYSYHKTNHKKHAPVVFTNRPVKHKYHKVYQQRPIRRHPHLVVKKPHHVFNIRLDGHRYLVKNNHFYTHVPQRGYVLVERPHHIQKLPRNVVKVRINGNFYYRYNTLLFEWTPFGFRVV